MPTTPTATRALGPAGRSAGKATPMRDNRRVRRGTTGPVGRRLRFALAFTVAA